MPLGLLAKSHQAEAEIRFGGLLAVVQADQRPADQMGDDRPKTRIKYGQPEHVARDGDRETADRQRDAAGEIPQERGKGGKRRQRVQDAETQGHGSIDKEADVLGDPLIRVVDPRGKTHAIESPVGQPACEISIGQPAPPAQLKRLIQIDAQHRDREVEQDQRDNDDEGAIETGSVLLLQSGEERSVRLVLQDVDAHQAEIETDDRGQEQPRRPPFLTSPIALGQNPDVACELSKPRHPTLRVETAFLREGQEEGGVEDIDAAQAGLIALGSA
jgi:hypothetical protein